MPCERLWVLPHGYRWLQTSYSQPQVDPARPRMARSSDDWLRVIADALGWMALDGPGWFWVLTDSFRLIHVAQRFSVLVATVKFVVLNLKEVGNCGKFL